MEPPPLRNLKIVGTLPQLSLGTKIYVPSATKTEMNLVPFVFWAVCAVKVILKISAILLKHPAFEGARA